MAVRTGAPKTIGKPFLNKVKEFTRFFETHCNLFIYKKFSVVKKTNTINALQGCVITSVQMFYKNKDCGTFTELDGRPNNYKSDYGPDIWMLHLKIL